MLSNAGFVDDIMFAHNQPHKVDTVGVYAQLKVNQQGSALGMKLLSTIVLLWLQVIMKLMEMMDQSSDFVTMLVKKLAPPLVTLLSAEPEIQYVALRNINLVVQKRFLTICDAVTMLPLVKNPVKWLIFVTIEVRL